MQRRFQGVLEPVEIGISSLMVRIPFDPVEVWPVRSKLRVKGSISTAYKGAEPLSVATSLLRSHHHGYFLLVTGRMRKALHVSVGAHLIVTLEPDLDDLAATPPPEFAKFLKADRSLKKWFTALNYSMRKYVADDIQAVKSAETRKRRAEQWAERMMLTMEGEEYPPPILQMAFRRQPLARAGWDAMTANQRRMALIGIFSTKSPEAQAKRVEWTLAEAMKAAQRTKPVKRSVNRRAKTASDTAE
jgi:Bacteriocin-protection, YdeI or OmpD-Associated/Domain of unknown function (DUF1905)